jgi:hypothetical protein
MEKEQVEKILGARSVTNVLLKQHRTMLDSEYHAFETVSSAFKGMISVSEYAVARLNVLTRSFPVGMPGDDEASEQMSLTEELKSYKDSLGIDFLEGGCRAMIPIADLLNHHPKKSVSCEYKESREGTKEFVIDSFSESIEDVIKPGTELMASYGKLSDAQLFARYGFLNGDGSGIAQATISYHHDVLNIPTAPQFNLMPNSGKPDVVDLYQRNQLKQYLNFDDGYADCIEDQVSPPEVVLLKRLKFEHLVKISNQPERWTVDMPPRSPESGPARSTEVPIAIEAPIFEHYDIKNYIEWSSVQSTCRLIALINSDYEGKAIEILRENLDTDDFRLEEGNDALEFRTLVCLQRYVSSETAASFVGHFPDILAQVKHLNKHAYGSREWTAYHAKLADIQALHALSAKVRMLATDRFIDKQDNPPLEYTVRAKSCPSEFTDFLLD